MSDKAAKRIQITASAPIKNDILTTSFVLEPMSRKICQHLMIQSYLTSSTLNVSESSRQISQHWVPSSEECEELGSADIVSDIDRES